jgi:AraC-like DNA-binding protein
MNDSVTSFADWHFLIVARLQTAACDLEGADPAQFRLAIDRLIRALPQPQSPAGARTLSDTLHSFATSAGTRFHRHFHRLDASCGTPALLEQCEGVWTNGFRANESPVATLGRWTREFLAQFEASHRWPPEVRAAMYLRDDFRRPLNVDGTAAAVAVSRTALTRRFKRAFGVSLGEYQRILRACEAIRLLRETQVCADAVARDVGYQSTKNLYAVLRSLTGFRPEEIRRSSPDAFATFSQLCRDLRIEPPTRRMN